MHQDVATHCTDMFVAAWKSQFHASQIRISEQSLENMGALQHVFTRKHFTPKKKRFMRGFHFPPRNWYSSLLRMEKPSLKSEIKSQRHYAFEM